MKHHVFIDKQHLFQLGYIQIRFHHRAGWRPTQGSFSTLGADIHLGPGLEHGHRDDSGRSIEAVLEETLCRGPSFIDKPLKRGCRQARPEFSADRPLLLEECPKGRVVKPEEAHVPRIGQRMLRAPDSLKVFVVEPIDIRMRIPRVPRSAINIPSVHRPEVGDDINVRFCDVR
jgi:hypothetical protein